MEEKFISIKEELPDKGKDIIGKTPDGDIHYVFRCACHNPKCKEWRCSLTGFGMMIEVESWRYDTKNKIEKK